MQRSSLPPEGTCSLKRKKSRNDDDSNSDKDGSNTEPEQDSDAPSKTALSCTNVNAAMLHYAAQKQLWPDQSSKLDLFLLVSIFSYTAIPWLLLNTAHMQDSTTLAQQAKVYIAILSVENKLDNFSSTPPPY